MMLMLIADVIVVLGCGYIGAVLASRIDSRIAQIDELEKMLAQLAFNIGFLALPMKDAIKRITAAQGGAVYKILKQTSELMEKYPDITVGEAWNEAIKCNKDLLCLKPDELEALRDFTCNIGKGDCQQSLDNIHITAAKLKLAKEEAVGEKNKNGKLYKGTGFLLGMLIVILLF